MKRLTRQFKSCWLQRIIIFVMGFICIAGNIHATETYYYKATATVSRTNGVLGGKVYVSKDATNNPNYTSPTSTVGPNAVNGVSIGITSFGPDVDVNFYALANEGYVFDGWKRDGKGNYVSESTHYIGRQSNVDWLGVEHGVNGSYSNPTPINFTAYFTKLTGIVRVYPAVGHETRGRVTISNPDNQAGQTVTIEAIPDISQGTVFLGWSKDDKVNFSNPISDNPYTLTVPNVNQVTYYAYFSEPATSVYCILQNVATQEYLSLCGEVEAETHSSTYKYGTQSRTLNDGYTFTNGLKTINANEIANNPMIVFKRVATKDINNNEIGDLATDVPISWGNHSYISVNALTKDNSRLYFSEEENGLYRIYTKYKTTGDNNQEVNIESYLCDDESDFVTMQGLQGNSNPKVTSNSCLWRVIYLTEDEVDGAFGAKANAKYTQDRLYYTTMYAPFAYKLLDGVNAYYLDLNKNTYHDDKGTLTLTQIASGNVVPAKMPVILECTVAGNAKQNRLLPVGGDADYPKPSDVNNTLRGYTQIYNKDNELNTVVNDQNLKYVFSIDNNGRLGFYHLNKTTHPNMTPNKAFLELPVPLDELSAELNKGEEEVSNIKLVFGKQFDEDDLNSINLLNKIVDDADAPIYNLQGVQMTNPEKGIYIRGGKKYLVK